MCWRAKNMFDIFPHRAKKDIEVYKIVFDKNQAPICNYVYSLDREEPKIKIKLEFWNWKVIINEGYHSYSRKSYIERDESGVVISSCDKYKLHANYLYSFENIHLAIIPKGSKYFINGFGEIVSERIIVTSRIIAK